MKGTWSHWFENHEASFTTWESCVAELKRTILNHHHRQRAEGLLQTRVQGPNESVTSLVEDVLRLSARANPEAAKEKELRILMRGVKAEIFGGLVRNPPTTVNAFVSEATNIERALTARASHYHRIAGAPAAPTVAASLLDVNTSGADSLREIVREVVREELRKIIPAAGRPSSLSLAEVVREEVYQSLQPEVLVGAAPEPPTQSYAAATRRPPPPSSPVYGATPT